MTVSYGFPYPPEHWWKRLNNPREIIYDKVSTDKDRRREFKKDTNWNWEKLTRTIELEIQSCSCLFNVILQV